MTPQRRRSRDALAIGGARRVAGQRKAAAAAGGDARRLLAAADAAWPRARSDPASVLKNELARLMIAGGDNMDLEVIWGQKR